VANPRGKGIVSIRQPSGFGHTKENDGAFGTLPCGGAAVVAVLEAGWGADAQPESEESEETKKQRKEQRRISELMRWVYLGHERLRVNRRDRLVPDGDQSGDGSRPRSTCMRRASLRWQSSQARGMGTKDPRCENNRPGCEIRPAPQASGSRERKARGAEKFG
jgi:hypothetical protein